MKQVLLILFGLLFILHISCEYETGEIYQRHLDQNVSAPEIEIASLDLDPKEDTIELLYNRVYFHFKSSDQKIRSVTFYLNDSSIGTAYSEKGYFDMYCNFLFSGTHRLRLELFTFSGTGSIADSLGMEGFLISTREWIIEVFDTEYLNITSTVSDGFLQLRWEKPSEEVTEFIIYRWYEEIGRSTTCSFIDKGYVGEGATYRVNYVSSYNGELMQLGRVEIPTEMKLRFICDDNNNWAVSWGKLKYYAAVDSIIVMGNDGTYAPYEYEKTTDVSRTSFSIPNQYFGQLRHYQLVLIPKYDNPLYNSSNYPYQHFCSPVTELMIGYPSPIFRDFLRISDSEFIYHTNMYDHGSTAHNDSIFRFSLQQNKILDRYRYNPPNYSWSGDHYYAPAVSPDGNYFIAHAGNTETVIYGPTRNLDDYQIIDLNHLSIHNMVSKIPISCVGTGLVIASYKVFLYDFENDSILGFINNSISLSDHNISSDGKYFYLSSSHTVWLYKYSNNEITLEKTLTSWDSPGVDYFSFMADEPDKIVCWNKDSKTFSVINRSDFTLLNSFKVNEDEILDIDYFTRQILSSSSDILVVRNLDDGSLLHSIPVKLYPIRNLYLAGNSIIYEKGARYFLK